MVSRRAYVDKEKANILTHETKVKKSSQILQELMTGFGQGLRGVSIVKVVVEHKLDPLRHLSVIKPSLTSTTIFM